jgi:hypothetical protein
VHVLKLVKKIKLADIMLRSIVKFRLDPIAKEIFRKLKTVLRKLRGK